MTNVMGEVNATHKGILFVQLRNLLPRGVTTAVIDEHHYAVVGNQSVSNHALEQDRQSLDGVV